MMWNMGTFMHSNINIVTILEGEERGKWKEKKFNEFMAEDFWNLMKTMIYTFTKFSELQAG